MRIFYFAQFIPVNKDKRQKRKQELKAEITFFNPVPGKTNNDLTQIATYGSLTYIAAYGPLCS